jgi:hypothetical protein
MAKEVESRAPLMYKLLSVMSQGGSSHQRSAQSTHSHEASIVVATAILLRERNMHMNALPYILSILLWHGNASKETMERLNQVHLSVSHTSLLRKLSELGEDFDRVVHMWKNDNISFQIIMDNVDKRCKARYMTMNNQNKDHHWCNAYAHRNRITAGMLLHGTVKCMHVLIP